MNQAIVIIGIGNEYRRDDAAGLIAARRFRAMNLPDVKIIEASGDGVALMELWREAETVILIDAIRSGAEAGTIHSFDAHRQPLRRCFFNHSTHAFGVAEAIELARAIDRLPPRLMVYGIEGKDFAAGIGLSPEVESAVGASNYLIASALGGEATPPSLLSGAEVKKNS